MNNSYLTYETTLPAVILVDGNATSNFLKLEIDIRYGSVDTNDDEYLLYMDVMYQKLCFWLRECLLDLVVVCAYDESSFDIVSYIKNANVMITPDYPSDEHIATLLHCKLNTMANGFLNIGNIRIKTNNSPLSNIVCYENGMYDLPSDNYVEEYSLLHDMPWWYRKTSDISDMFCEDFEDEVCVEDFFEEDILDEFERKLMEKLSNITEEDSDPTNVSKIDDL